MQVETENGETNEVPPLSEVIASVEDVLGAEHLLQDGRGRFPQFRLGGLQDGTILFLDIDDLSDDEVDELVEETSFEPTSNRSSLQCRVYYEALAERIPA